MLIHTTEKYITEIEKAKGRSLPMSSHESNDSSQVAHVVILNRRKALVLIHSETLLTLVAWPLKKEELSKIERIIDYVRHNYFDYLGLNWVNQMEIEDEIESRDITFIKEENPGLVSYLEDTVDFLKSAVRVYDDETVLQLKLMEKVNNRSLKYPDGSTDTPLKKWENYLSNNGLGENLIFTPPVVELKVSLKLDTEPEVIRKLHIPMTCTFNQLHHIIQKAFMWDDYHLHQFVFDRPNDMSVCLVDNDESFGYKERFQIMKYDEDVQLIEYLRSGDVFTYEYDFGDDWIHEIEVSEIIENATLRTARVVEMRGDPVPENVGGTGGYAEFKRVMSDPTDEQYDHFSLWSERYRNRLSIHSMEWINRSIDRF